MDELTAMAHRELMTLSPARMRRRYKSVEAFEAAIERIDVVGGKGLRHGPALLGALAMHPYSDDLHLETADGDYYVVAANTVEMDAEDMPWAPLIEDGRLGVDDVAEVLELMIIETANSPDAAQFAD